MVVGRYLGRGNTHPHWSVSWAVNFNGTWWFKTMEEGVGRTAAHVNFPLRGGLILSRYCLSTYNFISMLKSLLQARREVLPA